VKEIAIGISIRTKGKITLPAGNRERKKKKFKSWKGHSSSWNGNQMKPITSSRIIKVACSRITTTITTKI